MKKMKMELREFVRGERESESEVSEVQVSVS